MKVSGFALVATIIFLVAMIVIGPYVTLGLEYRGNRYEIPNVGASPSVQQ
jgi:uncharacterized membrane protein